MIAASIVASPQAFAVPSRTTRYACSKGLSFEVELRRAGRIAVVRTPSATLILKGKRSRLGRQYASADAALIIDGDFAAFVQESGPWFSDCLASRDLGE